MRPLCGKFWQVTSQTVVMDVGEVRVAEDADFKRLKSLCDETDGWKQEYNKNNTTVSTKINELSDFQMVKVRIFNIFNFVLTVMPTFLTNSLSRIDHQSY